MDPPTRRRRRQYHMPHAHVELSIGLVLAAASISWGIGTCLYLYVCISATPILGLYVYSGWRACGRLVYSHHSILDVCTIPFVSDISMHIHTYVQTEKQTNRQTDRQNPPNDFSFCSLQRLIVFEP